MDAFELADVLDRQSASGQAYLEFFKVADLSVGLYVLEPGEPDRQQPHSEDEVREVREGSIVFVPAGVPHRFHDITAELRLLVVFGPAEYSRA